MKKIILILSIFLNFSLIVRSEWVPVRVEPSPLFPNDSINLSIIFSGMDCADSMNCMAAGNDAYRYRIVYQSTDAGRTWNILYKPDFNSGIKDQFPLLRSIVYATNNRCIIGSDSGVIIRTDDGGKNWTRINTPIFFEDNYEEYKRINHIKMLDSNIGIASSGQYLIYTSDGGSNWTYIPKPDSNMGMSDVHIFSPSTIYLRALCWSIDKDCPYKYTFFRSYDLGKHWEGFDYSSIGGMNKMSFADSLNGWMVGGVSNGIGDQEIAKIGATKDGGKTWNLQFKDSLKPLLVSLMDVSFKNNSNGIAVGRVGTAMRTTNGGLNWFPDNINVDLSKPYLIVPVICYRNLNEPLFYGLPGRIYYNSTSTYVAEQDRIIYDILIFPNPVNDYMTVCSIQFNIEIFSTLGLKVFETEWQEKIDVSGLSPGIYFVKIGNAMNKFIKL
jgi:photosystem II stability/assembly factor-like uncharacterized protein